MKTLLDINYSTIVEYGELERFNKEWDISSYLNMKYEMNVAIALSKLYFPNFIEKENCVVLDFRYNEHTFKEWHKHFKGDIKKIEFMCNYYDVQDYFTTSELNYETDEQYFLAVEQFGKILQRIWQINLDLLFPQRTMKVDLWEEENVLKISLFSDTDIS